MTQEQRTEPKGQGVVCCPYCGSDDIEPLALFGQQLLTVQLYCRGCHTPFEYVKDEAILDVFSAPGESRASGAQARHKGEQR